MEVICGYDMNFVGEIPEYLKCAICCLALKKPIQITSCGHRFCAACFEGMKTHARSSNTDLRCPIDRNKVDVNHVFADKGIERLVFDLTVKCPSVSEGCLWTGELRNLEQHVHSKCVFEDKKRTHFVLQGLQQRLERYENRLSRKDKEMVQMKEEFAEEKIKLGESMKALHGQLMECQRELEQTKSEMYAFMETQAENAPSANKKARTQPPASPTRNDFIG